MGNICGMPTEGELLADKAKNSGADADVDPKEMIRVFEKQDELYLKQAKKNCVQDCFLCEAESEFKVSMEVADSGNFLHVQEDSNCIARLLCCGSRPWNTTFYWGAEPGGAAIMNVRRPFRMPAGCCKCCCRQEVIVEDVQNEVKLGSAKESCYCLAPNFNLYNAEDKVEYEISMPTCCCGTVPNCCSGSLKCCPCACTATQCCIIGCEVPFNIYKDGKDDKLGSIERFFPDPGMDAMTDAETFKLLMPTKVSHEMTAVFLATAVLINQLYFE